MSVVLQRTLRRGVWVCFVFSFGSLSAGFAQTLTQVSTAPMIGATGNAGGSRLQASVQSVPSGVSSGAQAGFTAGSAQTVVLKQAFAIPEVAPAVIAGGGGGGGGGCAALPSGRQQWMQIPFLFSAWFGLLLLKFFTSYRMRFSRV